MKQKQWHTNNQCAPQAFLLGGQYRELPIAKNLSYLFSKWTHLTFTEAFAAVQTHAFFLGGKKKTTTTEFFNNRRTHWWHPMEICCLNVGAAPFDYIPHKEGCSAESSLQFYQVWTSDANAGAVRLGCAKAARGWLRATAPALENTESSCGVCGPRWRSGRKQRAAEKTTDQNCPRSSTGVQTICKLAPNSNGKAALGNCCCHLSSG